MHFDSAITFSEIFLKQTIFSSKSDYYSFSEDIYYQCMNY